MVPHFWEQGSAGPTEAAVFNLYKLQVPKATRLLLRGKPRVPPNAMSFDPWSSL